MSAPPPPAIQELHDAAANGDLHAVRSALEAVPAHSQEETHGRSALMLAAGAGHEAVVEVLLAAGAPWNAIDRRGQCAGNYALDAGHQTVVDALVDHAVRVELLLGASERRAASSDASNAEYLSRSIKYDGDRLLDTADDAVMMEWEAPLMRAHAARLCAAGGSVMNIGFGMGIVDRAIQTHAPTTHTIVEAHPMVFAKMERDGWTDKRGVRCFLGRWQDVLPTLPDGSFDAIYFDTYGEHDADMVRFHEELPRLLRPGGVYSFFNGLCPFNGFFQGVACQVVQLELEQLGFAVAFEALQMEPLQDAEWEGVRRRYYLSDVYHLPHAVYRPDLMRRRAAAAAAATHVSGVVAQFARANGGALRLFSRSLSAPSQLEGVAGLRELLETQVVPHLESVGWCVGGALRALWRAADAADAADAAMQVQGDDEAAAALDDGVSDAEVESAAAGLDTNSAQLLRLIVADRLDDDGRAVDDLALGLVPNPAGQADGAAGGGDDDADVEEDEENDEEGGEEGGGKDSEGRAFATVGEFWARCAEEASGWYATAGEHWRGESGDLAGMLGGLDAVHDADLKASRRFLDELLPSAEAEEEGGGAAAAAAPVIDGVALDCGAGIGRVSEAVLLPRFRLVELLEAEPSFLEAARASLPAARVQAMHASGLQQFAPAAGVAYAAVWVQWVLNYVTDADLVGFLRRAAAALRRDGVLVVKESVARRRGGGFYADLGECSITRTDAHFRRLFGEAGLAVHASCRQPGMPRGLFPVRMYALRPADQLA